MTSSPPDVARPVGRQDPGRLALLRWRTAFARDPLTASRRLVGMYGDLVAFGRDCYVVGSAELVHAVLRQPARFARERGAVDAERMLWGDSIVVSHGAQWLRKRRLLEGTLEPAHSATTLREVFADELAGWSGTRPVLADLRRLTARLAVRNVLGDDLSAAEVAEVEAALDAIHVMFANRAQLRFSMDTPQKRDFRAAITRLDELVHRSIRWRLEGVGTGRDMLSLLVERVQPADEATAAELRDEVVTQLRAGHRNGSTVLAWVVGLLAHHPDVADRVHAECREHGDDPFTPAEVGRLVRVGEVVREAMRLYPLYPLLDRTLAEPTEIAGRTLPERTRLILAIDSVHRDARYFTSPDEFQPRRWTAEFEKSLPRGSYVPFGAGPRVCPFQAYGMLEATLATAELARRFRFVPTESTRMVRRFTPNGLLPAADFAVTMQPITD